MGAAGDGGGEACGGGRKGKQMSHSLFSLESASGGGG